MGWKKYARTRERDDDAPTKRSRSVSDHVPTTIQKFDLSTRKTEKALEGVARFTVSANGEKMLYLQGENWMLAPVAKPPAAGEGTLKLDTWRVYVDPRAEWKQMYREAWRLQRDFFYDPGFHGLDLAAAEKEYAPWVEHLSSRSDLTYLMQEMLGELTVGHMFVW
jgi:tricorn protease